MGKSSGPSLLLDILRAALWPSLFIALWTWLATLVRPLDRAIGIAIPPALAPVGLLLGVAGFALALTCALWFAIAGRGTPAPFDAPRAFVASGPYRFVRNPMYVGGGGAIAGAGLFLGSPAIVLLALGFLLLMHLLVVSYEEPHLRDRFGDGYRDYCARVGRWWPRRSARRPS